MKTKTIQNLIMLSTNSSINSCSLCCAYLAVFFSVYILISSHDIKNNTLILFIIATLYILSVVLKLTQYISARIAVNMYRKELKRYMESLKEISKQLQILSNFLEERSKEYEEINRK